MTRRTLPPLTLCAIAALLATAASPDVSTVPAAPLAPAAETADDRPLWRLHEQDRIDDLHRLLGDYQRWFPHWQPPLELVVRVALEHEAPAAFVAELLDAAAQAQPARFGCNEIHHVWALERARRTAGNREGALAAARTALAACTAAVQLTTLERLQSVYPFAVTETLLSEALARDPALADTAAWQSYQRGLYRAWIAAAARAPAAQRVPEAVSAWLAADAGTRRDATSARLLGWWALARNRHDGAARWFAQALEWHADGEAAHGLVLAWSAQGRHDDADALARRWQQREPALARWLAAKPAPVPDRDTGVPAASEPDFSAEIAHGWAAYRDGDAAQAMVWFERVHVVAPTPETAHGLALSQQARADDAAVARLAMAWGDRVPSILVLHGWNLYRAGHMNEAGEVFTRAYHLDGSRDAAEGVIRAALAGGSRGNVAAMVASDRGELAAVWPAELAHWNYDRGELRAAGALQAASFPALNNIDSLALSVMPRGRYRSGSPGLGRVHERGLTLRADGGRFPHRLLGQLDLFDVDSGIAAAGSAVGTPGQPWVTAPTQRARLAQPQVSYRFDGAVTIVAGVGSTPLGGAADPKLTGHLSVGQTRATQRLALSAFARSRDDSLLAMSGVRDPATGQVYGAVVERGIEGSLWQQLSPHLVVDAGAAWSRLEGQNVATNQQWRTQVFVGYGIDSGLQYLTAGPIWRIQRYEHNLSHYTAGHGGYFSPQRFQQAGLQLVLQTHEGRDVSVQAQFFAGYEWSRMAATSALPLASGGPLPLASGGPLHDGDIDSGFALSGEISATWRLGPHWQLGAFVAGQHSSRFDEFAGGLRLRWLRLPRPAVTSLDLPRPPTDERLRF
jgi:tetratricopeptide (TPR) repeat protein